MNHGTPTNVSFFRAEVVASTLLFTLISLGSASSTSHAHDGGSETNRIWENLSAKQMVEAEAKKANELLDLSSLCYYGYSITKADLAPLSSARTTKNLKNLNLHDVAVDDHALEAVSPLHLEAMDLGSCNQLHNLHALRNMLSLRHLDLRRVPLDHDAYLVLGSLQKLITLQLPETNTDKTDLRNLYSLTDLKILNLFDCKNVGATDLFSLKRHLKDCHIQYGKSFAYNHNSNTIDRLENLVSKGRHAEAERALLVLIARAKALKTPDYDTVARCYALVGRSQSLQAQRANKTPLSAEAKESFEQAIKAASEHDCASDNILFVLALYAKQLERSDRVAEAARLRSHWNAVFAKNETRTILPIPVIYRTENLFSLGHEYYLQKNNVEALATYATAEKLFDSMATDEKGDVARYVVDTMIVDTLTPKTIRAQAMKIGKTESRSATPSAGEYFADQ